MVPSLANGVSQTSTAPRKIDAMHAMLRVVAVSVRGQLMKEFIEVDDVAGLPVVTPAMQEDDHDQMLMFLSQAITFW